MSFYQNAIQILGVIKNYQSTVYVMQFSFQDKQVHHFPVNLLQMESRIEQANTMPLVCKSDLLPCLISNPSHIPEVEIKPNPFFQDAK